MDYFSFRVSGVYQPPIPPWVESCGLYLYFMVVVVNVVLSRRLLSVHIESTVYVVVFHFSIMGVLGYWAETE